MIETYWPLIMIGFVLGVVMTIAPGMIWLERRLRFRDSKWNHRQNVNRKPKPFRRSKKRLCASRWQTSPSLGGLPLSFFFS